MGSNDNFVKVFAILDSGFKDWGFAAFGMIFVAFGMIIVAYPNAPGIRHPFKSTFSRYCFLICAILWTSVVFLTLYFEHQRHVTLAQNRCRIVEGPVENFVPMPHGGHAEESFSVAGVPFKYSDFIVTDAFNNTSSHGGPIRSDLHVRICYDPSENAILRLEIRDRF